MSINILPTRRRVLKAVRELNSRLTVADVVASTGLSPNETAQELNVLAGETKATLEVTKAGEIYYCFPANLAYVYLARGFKRAFLVATSAIYRAVFFLVKLSFGVLLLSSIVVVFSVILLYQTMFASWFGNTETVGKIWGDFFQLLRVFVFRNLINLKSLDTSAATSSKQQGFLLDCFSFLFGDGNPNEHIDQERWKLLAQVIRLNEGVVVGEHLAPYTGQAADDLPSIFQVLAKFSGQARLTPSMQLVYVFPSMMQRSTNVSYAFMPSSIREQSFQFSNLSKEQMRPVLAIAGGNFFGALLIYCVVSAHLDPRMLPIWFTGILVYGALFVIFPCLRWLIAKHLNKGIELRNAQVAKSEEDLGHPDAELHVKLEEAEDLRRQQYAITDSTKVVYRTNKDYLEQLTDELGEAK